MPQYLGTTTPLGGGASYTSSPVVTEVFTRFTGTVYADQAGTLHVEQGPDGTNWDGDNTTAVSASTATNFNVAVVAPYLRVRYVNGGVAQTVFRLSPRFDSWVA